MFAFIGKTLNAIKNFLTRAYYEASNIMGTMFSFLPAPVREIGRTIISIVIFSLLLSLAFAYLTSIIMFVVVIFTLSLFITFVKTVVSSVTA